MNPKNTVSRREALKKAAITSLVLPFIGTVPAWAAESTVASTPEIDRTHGLKIGVAGYSFQRFSIDEVIPVLSQLDIKYFAVFKSHVPVEAGTVEECRIAGQKFKDAGITLTSTGVVNLHNDEATVKKAFENARAAGLPTFTCKPAKDCFALLDKYVKEYDIKLAIHNHGPEDEIYPSPYDAWKAVQDYDKRIGLCIDIGHTTRLGQDPVEAIRKCRDRLYDVHLKDSIAVIGSKKDIPVEVGRGRVDIKGVLSALIEIKYAYQAGFEYEKSPNNPVPGLAESVGYVRGMLAAM